MDNYYIRKQRKNNKKQEIQKKKRETKNIITSHTKVVDFTEQFSLLAFTVTLRERLIRPACPHIAGLHIQQLAVAVVRTKIGETRYISVLCFSCF